MKVYEATPYEWKTPGLFKADANLVANEILSINEGKGATPKQIVEKARNPESELHKCFTWDDTVAAEKWRLQEARLIAANIVFVVTNKADNSDQPEKTKIKFFHNTDGKHDSGYKSIKLIIQNPDEYQALLRHAKLELKAFRDKYSNLKELSKVFIAIDALE